MVVRFILTVSKLYQNALFPYQILILTQIKQIIKVEQFTIAEDDQTLQILHLKTIQLNTGKI